MSSKTRKQKTKARKQFISRLQREAGVRWSGLQKILAFVGRSAPIIEGDYATRVLAQKAGML